MKYFVLVLCLFSCKNKQEKIERAVPKPLEALLTPEDVARLLDAGVTDAGFLPGDAIFQIKPLPILGPALPGDAVVVDVVGESAKTGAVPFVVGPSRVLLMPDADTYLSQVAPLLTALHDSKATVFLKHPDANIAFKITLRDEPGFVKWLEEAVPGKIRVIHRADGFELQTNIGKLPGGDPRGPTVPLRGGNMDLFMLQRGFSMLQKRFSAPDLCFVPSFGMELSQVARAMAAVYREDETALFQEICLIYPRPALSPSNGPK
jgi:hypothetical protein